MFNRRLQVLVAVTSVLFAVCILRLVQMQVLKNSYYRKQITRLKKQRGLYSQLKTIRGKILDRNGQVLAEDEPQFQLSINYSLSSLLDPRAHPGNLDRANQNKLKNLIRLIEKCARFKGTEPQQIKNQIKEINKSVWNLRSFQAWRKNCRKSDLLQKYDRVISIPLSKALQDFQKKIPDPDKRAELTRKVKIAEMHRDWPLVNLETENDIFTAQLEFLDVNGIRITASARRAYPSQSAAAQTIGWVGKPQKKDERLFQNDPLASYRPEDVCGREDGIEFLCETILRGKRGEARYNIDRELVKKTPTRFGQNVKLTLDIKVQKEIEQYITDCNLNENCTAPTSAVVMDVSTGEILSLVSLPAYDLNRVRYIYSELASDPNHPLINRAINKQYPPGSVVKPLILTAGLESGNITPTEIISCPSHEAPKGWPDCWIFNRYGIGHDVKWRNHAENAIKGSCNVYFSRLASRIDPVVLQLWLFRFGYARQLLFPPASVKKTAPNRYLRQAPGQISSRPVSSDTGVTSFQKIPPLAKRERRYFGIGQGNLRVTPLQVANAMATIARDGKFKFPRLFLELTNDTNTTNPELTNTAQNLYEKPIDLNISDKYLSVVRNGMFAVVNETGGTAYNAFADSKFEQLGVTVYGKTGSTEKPDLAWFAGFATDTTDQGIAVAVVVEGGQHGSSDAAPLAKEIIKVCIDARYLTPSNTTP